MVHLPIVLKIADWPEADRAMWNQLFARGRFFDRAGPLHRLADGSRALHTQGYGQWLSFLARRHADDLALAPTLRITPDRARAYLAECEARLAPTSIVNLIGSIDLVAHAAAPERDWSWLRQAFNHLNHNAKTLSVPPPEPISAGQIFLWSLGRLAEVTVEKPTKRRAIHFRQALKIGFLIARPVRRRALLAMRVDRHVVAEADGYRLNFGAEDMKDKRARSFLLPKDLVPHMKAYLETYRPLLAGGKETDGFWLSQYGNPLTGDGLSRELPKVTLRHLGVALRPHAFRHIAATSIAETDPEHVNIIKDILGHASLDMAERHYNRATQISSADRWQSLIDDICREGAKLNRPRPADREGGPNP